MLAINIKSWLVHLSKSINTKAKQALYDNLEDNENLAVKLDDTIRKNKLDGWRDGGIKEKKLQIEIDKMIGNSQKTIKLMKLLRLKMNINDDDCKYLTLKLM